MRLLLPNFQFEDTLREPSFRPRGQTMAALEDLATTMAVLADPDDRVLLRTSQPPQGLPDWLACDQFVTAGPQPSSGRLVPWGWTEDCRRWDDGQSPAPPEQICVHRVNSREFLALHDRVWLMDGGWQQQPFGLFCRTPTEWAVAIRRLSSGESRWCAKPQYSHAGRNRLLGSGTSLNDQQRGWRNRQLQAGGVYVEPWCRIEQEWSLHFDVTVGGDVRLIGATELINDEMGRYAGNLVCSPEELQLPDEVLTGGRELARECGRAGYWGPLGLDGFRFRDANGNAGIRICNDINARYSMGRLALAGRRLCQPTDRVLWCQIRTAAADASKQDSEFSDPSETARMLLATYDQHSVCITRVSPLAMGRRPVRTATLLLSGDCVNQLKTAQRTLREHLA